MEDFISQSILLHYYYYNYFLKATFLWTVKMITVWPYDKIINAQKVLFYRTLKFKSDKSKQGKENVI